jgi:hypothetical protein
MNAIGHSLGLAAHFGEFPPREARLNRCRSAATYPTIAARTNRLAYVQRSMDANIWQIAVPTSSQLIGQARKVIASTRDEAGPQFSRDGSPDGQTPYYSKGPQRRGPLAGRHRRR